MASRRRPASKPPLAPEMELLIRILDESYEKKAWHGPNLRGSIRDLPVELARASVNSTELESHLGETVSLVGWVIAQRRATTRKREYMQFLTLEDPSGTFEATIFPRDYQRLGASVRASRILRVTGQVSDRAGSVGIIMSGWLGAVNYGVIVANEVDGLLMNRG